MSPGSLAHTVPLRAGLLGSLVVYQVGRVCRIRELDGEHVRKWQAKREGKQETLCHTYFSSFTRALST